ncbi:MAG: sulfoxide reductase heme-binding subunit YedZ [Chloroflexi bacterium]|nr:sulfoxide reductase heme-binding subunit YedZ [Chloroflexota bacterium]
MDRLKAHWLQILTHIVSLLPLAILIWDFRQDRLTANPIQEITLRTGSYSLILLLLSLACTPLNTMFGLKSVSRLRRPLGLYGFMYACLHTLNFIGLDYGFNLDLLREDVFGKAYIWAGVTAWLALLPVAITATRGWIKRLGRNSERLHWLVYPAALLSVFHFLLLVKADRREPLLYAAAVGLLLLLRLPGVRRVVNKLRDRLKFPTFLAHSG